MKKQAVLCVTAFVLASFVFLTSSFMTPPAFAQRPVPVNDPARGLIYDGLSLSTTPDCKNGLVIKLSDGSTMCVAEPDPIPASTTGRAPSAPNAVSPVSTTAAPVVCDGDGVTGYRVQVLYVRPTSTASQYATYLNSFRQWAADVDTYYLNSAAQTGGIRNVRFVTDANCYPVVTEVVISDTGATSFSVSVSELRAKGYNRTDRDYMIFMDGPRVYCGIGNIYSDDSAAQTNVNNTGPRYSRIDNTCWSGVIAAHELTHNLGGVQTSAPNSDGTWHCKDGFDIMCDYGGSTSLTYTTCPNSAFNYVLDCKNDDYFNTNPATGNYLATHWNVANSRFLINTPQIRVDSLLTGKLVNNTFSATDTFLPGDSVVVRAHVVDQNGANSASTTVNLTVNQPSGNAQCTLTGTSDSAGIAQVSCVIPKTAQAGSWTGHVASFTRSPYATNGVQSVTDHIFSVTQNAPTAVTLTSFTAQGTASTINNSTALNLVVVIIAIALVTGLSCKVWHWNRKIVAQRIEED